MSYRITRCLGLVLLTLVVTLGCRASGVARAENQMTPDDPRIVVATAYLEALYRNDWDGLAEHLTEDALFSDATGEKLSGAPWRLEGREQILEFFRASSAGTQGTFVVERGFVTGEWVVLSLRYSATIDRQAFDGKPGTLRVKVPAVTIVRVVEGRVTEHHDYVDYESLLEQADAQE